MTYNKTQSANRVVTIRNVQTPCQHDSMALLSSVGAAVSGAVVVFTVSGVAVAFGINVVGIIGVIVASAAGGMAGFVVAGNTVAEVLGNSG